MISNQTLLLLSFQQKRPKRVKHMFSQEEDKRIRELVSQMGDSNWNLIAEHMCGRSARQCRERWRNYLAPNVKNIPWTDEDDEELLDLVNKYGPQWAKIASSFMFRTDTNVKNRWILLQRKETRIQNSLSNIQRMQEEACKKSEMSSPEATNITQPEERLSNRPIIDFWDQSQWGDAADDELPENHTTL